MKVFPPNTPEELQRCADVCREETLTIAKTRMRIEELSKTLGTYLDSTTALDIQCALVEVQPCFIAIQDILNHAAKVCEKNAVRFQNAELLDNN